MKGQNIMKTVAFYTLGCKVNQYETQAICEMFEKNGYEVKDFDLPADIYIINTCSVTGLSDRKSRQMIRRARRRNENAVIAVTGCYAQTAAEDVLKIDGVNLVIGTQGRADIVKMCEQAQGKNINAVTDILHTHDFEEELKITEFEERTRAYVKMQEGCSQFCSYCIIPYARGPVRSRKKESVTEEIKTLANKGFCEIVLVGIHIASYGKDLEDTSLSDVIQTINSIDNIKRIRLSSIEPMTLNEEFLSNIAGADKLCPHFHISLQSGCDTTLTRMNRKYTSEDFYLIVKLLRAHFKDCAVTTDIMVGFPGETQEEFEESLAFVKKVGFADAHIFSYSIRPGTPAARMKEQVSPEEKQRRSELMFEATNKSRKEFLDKHTGRIMEVLFERECEKGVYEGKTNNYIHVEAESKTDISGKILPVEIKENDGFICIGTIKERK